MARHYVGNSTAPATPATPEQMADAVYTGSSGMGQADAAKFRDRYVQRMMADGKLDAQISAQTQLVLAEFLKAGGGGAASIPVSALAGGRSSHKAAMYNKRAPGAAADPVFADAGDHMAHEFFSAVGCRRGPNSRLDSKLSKLADIQNSFGSEVPDSGGFLVPEHLRSEILMMSLETATIRPRATVIPMDTLRVPIPMIDDTSHASSVLGGVQFYWTEEAASITESQATFGRIVLDAKKLSGYFAVPNELLADAPAFSAFFTTVVPKAHAWFEDLAYMTGTGVGEPAGFVNCPASVQVAKETGQPAATIVWENLVKMWSRMIPTSLSRAVWIAHIDTFPQLATMALSVGTGGGPVWIGGYPGAGGAATGADTPPVTILGRPVYFTEKLPQLGTTGDICFTDLGYYLIGDRATLQASSSEHYLFQNDKTAFRLLSRVDGRPWLQSALTPHTDSSNTLSAFVQLAAR